MLKPRKPKTQSSTRSLPPLQIDRRADNPAEKLDIFIAEFASEFASPVGRTCSWQKVSAGEN